MRKYLYYILLSSTLSFTFTAHAAQRTEAENVLQPPRASSPRTLSSSVLTDPDSAPASLTLSSCAPHFASASSTDDPTAVALAAVTSSAGATVAAVTSTVAEGEAETAADAEVVTGADVGAEEEIEAFESLDTDDRIRRIRERVLNRIETRYTDCKISFLADPNNRAQRIEAARSMVANANHMAILGTLLGIEFGANSMQDEALYYLSLTRHNPSLLTSSEVERYGSQEDFRNRVLSSVGRMNRCLRTKIDDGTVSRFSVTGGITYSEKLSHLIMDGKFPKTRESLGCLEILVTIEASQIIHVLGGRDAGYLRRFNLLRADLAYDVYLFNGLGPESYLAAYRIFSALSTVKMDGHSTFGLLRAHLIRDRGVVPPDCVNPQDVMDSLYVEFLATAPARERDYVISVVAPPSPSAIPSPDGYYSAPAVETAHAAPAAAVVAADAPHRSGSGSAAARSGDVASGESVFHPGTAPLPLRGRRTRTTYSPAAAAISASSSSRDDSAAAGGCSAAADDHTVRDSGPTAASAAAAPQENRAQKRPRSPAVGSSAAAADGVASSSADPWVSPPPSTLLDGTFALGASVATGPIPGWVLPPSPLPGSAFALSSPSSTELRAPASFLLRDSPPPASPLVGHSNFLLGAPSSTGSVY
jgi:hypothetical protein